MSLKFKGGENRVNIFDSAKRDTEKFLIAFTKIETAEAIGLIKMLGVHFFEEDELSKEDKNKWIKQELENKKLFAEKMPNVKYKPNLTQRPMNEILNDMIDRFSGLPRKQRKFILGLVEDASSSKENEEGPINQAIEKIEKEDEA